jgi:hypothetical protein
VARRGSPVPAQDEILPNNTWSAVVTYSDRISAEAIVGLLNASGIPTYIGSDEHVPGLGSNFSVFVSADLLRRARWLLQSTHVSEGELTELAVGELAQGTRDEPL